MRILVAGRTGQLARALCEVAATAEAEIHCLGRDEMDIADRAAIQNAFERYRPDLLVNAAAYTAVDRAESEAQEAFRINEQGAEKLASATHAAGIPIIHVSTDYVFNGKGNRPYREDDPTDPLNVYGRSKLAGEICVKEANPHHVIMRTSWVYSTWGANFLLTMLRLARERDRLSIVDDQYGTPTFAPDIADAIVRIARRMATGPASEELYGVFNFTNQGTTNWFGFAEAIFALAGKKGMKVPELSAIPTSQYPTPAQRPKYSVLDTERIAGVYAIRPRPWQDALAECMEKIG
ncbi:MAG: dTDP-4-dehydrorhamnose reductase [Rhizobiaceae bacterium]